MRRKKVSFRSETVVAEFNICLLESRKRYRTLYEVLLLLFLVSYTHHSIGAVYIYTHTHTHI